jgi:hypothetical protein
MYTEYLANAYSIMANEIQTQGDTGREYIWVTYDPFALGRWSGLLGKKELRLALKAHPAALNGGVFNEELVDLLVGRLWLLVTHDKQDTLTLTRPELQKIYAVLDRKA